MNAGRSCASKQIVPNVAPLTEDVNADGAAQPIATTNACSLESTSEAWHVAQNIYVLKPVGTAISI
jgi:hypothetical protein